MKSANIPKICVMCERDFTARTIQRITCSAVCAKKWNSISYMKKRRERHAKIAQMQRERNATKKDD